MMEHSTLTEDERSEYNSLCFELSEGQFDTVTGYGAGPIDVEAEEARIQQKLEVRAALREQQLAAQQVQAQPEENWDE